MIYTNLFFTRNSEMAVVNDYKEKLGFVSLNNDEVKFDYY